MNEVLARITEIVGAGAVLTGDELLERATSYWDSSPTKAKLLVRPTSTEQVSDVLRLCHECDQTVVVQGGLTGGGGGCKFCCPGRHHFPRRHE